MGEREEATTQSCDQGIGRNTCRRRRRLGESVDDRWLRLMLLGTPVPPAGAERVERMRFIRNYQLKWLPVNVVLLIGVAFVGLTWVAMILAVGTVILLLDAAWLTMQCRRGERR